MDFFKPYIKKNLIWAGAALTSVSGLLFHEAIKHFVSVQFQTIWSALSQLGDVSVRLITSNYSVMGYWIAGAVFCALITFGCVGNALWKYLRRPKLEKPISHLSKQQKDFLIKTINSGQRSFAAPFWQQRWFEELEHWGYVEDHSFAFASAPHMRVSELGWAAVQKCISQIAK